MWGNEMRLTPAPLWKWHPTWTDVVIASFSHGYTLLLDFSQLAKLYSVLYNSKGLGMWVKCRRGIFVCFFYFL